jgi:hypothetical protein
MEQRRLGRSGLKVSRLALGTMTWGRDTDEHEAGDQLKIFLEAGGTLLDTAAGYGDGESERVIGGLLARRSTERRWSSRPRPASPGVPANESWTPRGGPCSTRWTGRCGGSAPTTSTCAGARVERRDRAGGDALRGRPRGDHRPGAVCRHLELLRLADRPSRDDADRPGRAPLVSTQMEYSLLQRGIEREVLPAAEALGLGVLAWSPLGAGVLTGKYRSGTPADSARRRRTSRGSSSASSTTGAGGSSSRCARAADGLDASPLEVALALGARRAGRHRSGGRGTDRGRPAVRARSSPSG